MKKDTFNGCEFWRILYDAVMENPDAIFFHIGRVAMFRTGWRQYLKHLFFKKEMEQEHLGGELLTRCDDDILPKEYIGRAFGEMPARWMEEMFPVLLELQMGFIATLESEADEFYSVNIEPLDGNSDVWSRIFLILENWGKLPVNLEIKENAFLSREVLQRFAKLCESTGMGIYIDDLCSCCHKLPENNDYMAMMIEILHPHIRAVKIDYLMMQKILEPEVLCSVETNLKCFRRLWEENCNVELPTVIFESMPEENYRWVRFLRKLAQGYKGHAFQLG